METEVNEVKIIPNEIGESSETQDNILTIISDFHNYGLRPTTNATEAMPSNNTIPNPELPSNTNTDLYKSVIFKFGESYICPECKEMVLYLSSLKRHVRKNHPSLLFSLFPAVKPSSSQVYDICKETFYLSKHLKNKSSTVLSSVETNVSPFYVCNICQESFAYHKNLTRHVKSQHPDSFGAKGDFECNVCKKAFPQVWNLKRHVMKMHPSLFSTLFPSTESSAAHECNNCKSRFVSINSLQSHYCHSQKKVRKQHKCPLCPETLLVTRFNEHFEKSHNLLLKPVKINFGSYAVFCEWKKAIENITKSYFRKYGSVREINGFVHHKFICHRSGSFRSRAENKRKMKAKGSRKINAYCPAAMKLIIEEKEGKCEVTFQTQHLGHENELKYLDLTPEERKYVVDKLATNLPLNDLLNDIRTSASVIGAERLCKITKKDLQNIKVSSFSKNNRIDSSATKSDEKFMNDLRAIHNCHAESEHIKADISKIDKGWILTFTECNEIYLIKEKLKSCDCPLVCIYCGGCIKLYICSCSDSFVDGKMCKHIHFFCMQRNKIYDISDSKDFLDCDNNDESNSSNSEQCSYFQTSNKFASPKLLMNNNNVFVDSKKRNILKNKFSELIDSITTEDEYKLSESAIEDLSAKLKSMQVYSTDKNNIVIPATNHSVEIVYIVESTQDQNNSLSSITNQPVQIVNAQE